MGQLGQEMTILLGKSPFCGLGDGFGLIFLLSSGIKNQMGILRRFSGAGMGVKGCVRRCWRWDGMGWVGMG